MQRRILRLGGIVLSKGDILDTTAAAIATKKDVEKIERDSIEHIYALFCDCVIKHKNIEVCKS